MVALSWTLTNMSDRFILGGATLGEVSLDAVIVDAPATTQLTSTIGHGFIRDYWDRDEWGNIVPGACIRQY